MGHGKDMAKTWASSENKKEFFVLEEKERVGRD